MEKAETKEIPPREKKMKSNIPGINGGVCCGNETALVDM